jgi:hypothetical protein
MIGPPSPPAPVLHSPPRKTSAKEQQEWVIPPCISNWKNAKGYTIPLDKRLAADGRGLQEVSIVALIFHDFSGQELFPIQYVLMHFCFLHIDLN